MGDALPGTDFHAIHATGVDVGDPTEVVVGNATIRASGHYVPVGDRLAPDWIELELEGDASEPTVIGRVVVVDGAPVVAELRLVGNVRQKHLRAIEVDSLVDFLAGYSVTVDADGAVTLGAEDLEASVRELRSKRAATNRRITPEFLRQVAEVYSANIDSAPTEAVRERFFVSKRQASNYVEKCRDLGLLLQTSKGQKRGN